MKKSTTFAAVLALVALGTVSWASTNLTSLQSEVYQRAFENNVVSSTRPMAAQTITICKKTIPAGGSGFPFTWANGFGPLAPFTLNDGGCTTKNMTNQDHYNKFTENVPSGWILTNISCTSTTSPVRIIGADPNPAFQPGDNTVTIDLNEANVTCTFVNQRQPQVDPCCPPWNQDLLKEMMFYQGSGSISAPYTLRFQPSASFKNQIQSYINYLNSVSSAMTGIIIAWRLHDQGTGNLPNTAWGPQIPPTAFTKWTSGGNGNPTTFPAGGFFDQPPYPPFPMQIGTWYAVTTGIYLENGQNFFPKKCADVTIFVRIQVMSAKARGGPVLEFSDGKTVIKSVPISESKQQQR